MACFPAMTCRNCELRAGASQRTVSERFVIGVRRLVTSLDVLLLIA